MKHVREMFAAAAMAVLAAAPAWAAAPPSVKLRPVFEGTDVVTDINVVGNTVYACTQPGILWRAELPGGAKQPFLDLTGRVGTLGDRIPALPGLGYPDAGSYDERGLLGFAAAPDFDGATGTFWVWYSAIGEHSANPAGFFQWLVSTTAKWDMSEWDHVDYIDEYRMMGGAPTYQRTVLKLKRPYFNHTGFQSLYWSQELGTLAISVGDGGSEYDPNNIAQDDAQISGKLVRIDLDMLEGWDMGRGASGMAPVATFDDLLAAGAPRHAFQPLAKGLRNPSKVHEQLVEDREVRKGEGHKGEGRWVKVLANTGQDTIEFVNAFDEYGVNFGFRPWEGIFPTSFEEADGTRVISYGFEAVQLLNHRRPFAAYTHLDPVLRPNANTGSAIYRGKAIRGLKGRVVFSDWFSFDPATKTSKGLLLDAPLDLRDLQEQQPVEAIDVDTSAVSGPTLYYTSINTDASGGRIFVGGYKSVQFLKNPEQGGVYEVLPR